MTGTSERPKGPEASYQLNYESDGTSFTVRENLVDILERELLGPIHGPDELLTFSPRSQYLIGYIAPVKLSGTTTADSDIENTDERGELVEDRSDDEAVAEGRGVPAYAVDESEADSEDDDREDRAPKQGLMIPASMGLRFQVPPDLESFTVTASWGTYEPVQTDQVTKGGRPIRHYQRVPVEEPRSIRLTDLSPGRTVTVPLRESICLRVDRYDDPGFDRVLVEIALCNDRETPTPIPLGLWMFQTKLYVDAGGAEVFLPVHDVLEQDWPEYDDEVRRLNLQYRNRLEYAIGRTCSVDWAVKDGSRRASAVWTTWLPVAETPQTRARSVEAALLSMDALAHTTPEQLRAGLQPLVAGYGSWLDGQEAAATELPEHLRETADLALWEARQAHKRLQAGVEHVAGDEEALRCFRFMNQVMREQRIASQVAAARASDPALSISAARERVAALGEDAASWRPFQLAFILMQLGALTDPTAPLRSAVHQARVELLFFPTGGGKTEAYLGLAAYTFAIRRRQGVVESIDGPLDGCDGVAVLMRYTLRLLTAQQFQRATALMCAAELARRAGEDTWGSEPFRIGLWVGTDVSPKRFEEADEQLARANEYGSHRLTVLQVQRCPWCGTPITAAQVKGDATLRRVFVYCGDELARCPFAKGGTVAEGLPILTVDEEIYRLTPAFVIATVDKFARLAREGEAAALFGYVGQRCARHGYVHPDYAACGISTAHTATNGHPAATVRPVGRLRPPDLIIQDELHLITGALGTCVGLFEVAVETLASWEQSDGKPVRPLIVASTATVRNAQEQVRGLYGRQVEMFPPQVLDVADTFFSQEVPVSKENPGRRYVGVSAQGVRLASAEIRVAEVLLSAGQLLFDRCGDAADPYMTLVGYFNATRELAGMARYMADDVQNRVKRPRKDSGFPSRLGVSFGLLNIGELTSRIASSEIGKTLDRLGLEFDPDYDTTEASRARISDQNVGKKVASRNDIPFDVVLATSMLQVGVDVQRLGLMLVVGQPKNTAEYIQASSRVGRDASRPGLIVALGNWARPRDLAHLEQFRHYHETFYAQVEALSVTPYSPTSLDRGVDGLLVSAARVMEAHVSDGLSPEHAAWRINDQRTAVERIAERLEQRIAAAALSDETTKRASDLLVNRLDRWSERAKRATEMGKTLVYERTGESDKYLPLLISPENAKATAASSVQAPFIVANSMREVQPDINILVSPIPERLFARAPEGAPGWSLPLGEGE
ncbi:helicase [Mycobacterium marinum]|uniref:DISARM system helicase DrmA n=1 Tax=Mycobacterium marinum TaxID=1781 RepID=UPI0021C2E3D5|nr:DISARM system helicase DrmA [Mycobacterium marinum]GJO02303.1 helicase [Mycobacterium marinum]